MLAALVFSACSDTSVDEATIVAQNLENDAILFGTYLGNTQTTRADYVKGPITNGTGDQSLGNAKFGVFAYSTGALDYFTETTGWKATATNTYPNFMYNQDVASTDGTTWTYSPVKYWPNGIDALGSTTGYSSSSTTSQEAGVQKVSFFAYAPYAATTATPTDGALPTGVSAVKTSNTNGVTAISSNTSNSNVWVKYAMTDARDAEAVDLLWGTNGKASYIETDGTASTSATIGTGYNVDLTKQTVGEKVSFLFKHALAKVGGAKASGTESTTGNPASCAYKIVLDVDQITEGGTFDANQTLVTIEDVRIQDQTTAASDATVTTVTSGTSSMLKDGWFNIETGTWDVTGATTGATYNVIGQTGDKDASNHKYTLNEKVY